jgi:hypothetical protein
MESLLKIIKEANKDILEHSIELNSISDVKNHYMGFFKRVHDKLNFNQFEMLCIQDFKFNFPDGDKEITESENTNLDLNHEIDLSSDLRVKKFEEFNSEQKQNLIRAKKIKPILAIKPNEEFDMDGLRFDINHYNNIGGAVIFLPLEEMAGFCDVVTKTFVDYDERYWLISQYNALLKNYSDKETLLHLSSSHLGGLAYIYLHSRHQPSVDVSIIILNKYYDYLLAESLKIQQIQKNNLN